ncbi:MAG: phospholipid carrier-dependent glycosyltransferase [Candidatus Sumerlaeia bacterium]|nr:phospholipid carrier-dependent glycosyltransferase [Candidatus Sumerlaeia bacterium]
MTSNTQPIHSNATGRLEVAAIVLILALAAGLRFWGICFGFPERTRPDEQYFVNAVQRFNRLGTFDPDWFYYPSFYMYLNWAVWRTYAFIEWHLGNSAATTDTPRSKLERLEQVRARHPDIEYLLGRCVTALFGVATVAVAYFFTRRFWGRKAAVAAGFLLAVNSLHVLNSHFYKSDVATTFFTLSALACMAIFVECGARQVGGGWKWNGLAAICTGLAASTNYYGGFLLAPLAASQFMAHYESQHTSGDALQKVGRALQRALTCWQTYVVPLTALAVFAATSPYCFIRWNTFRPAFERMLLYDRQSLYDTMVRVLNFEDFGFQRSPLIYSFSFCWRYSMGMVLTAFSVLALARLAWRGRATAWLLLIFFAIHFGMTASGKAVFMRYYLSLVPILAIAAGAMFSSSAQYKWPASRVRQNGVVAFAAMLCGAEGLYCSVRQDHLLAQTDTRVLARQWLAENLPPHSIVGVPMDWWNDYYPYGKPTLPVGSRYVPVRPQEVRPRGIRFVLIDQSELRLYSNHPDWEHWPKANGRLLFEISPYAEPVWKGRILYDQLDAFYLPLNRFGLFTRPGPVIRIYEVIAQP